MTNATDGMLGGGYYDAHSAFQAKVAATGQALLEQAVAAIKLRAGSAATLVDYGCSEGRNSLTMIASALALLEGHEASSFLVLHNDLPSNDWSGLACNLAKPDSYLQCFPESRALFAPHGFFERVTAPASINLGLSQSAAHWLSQQPSGLDMPGSLYRSDAPPEQRAKILAQAAADWQAFLEARAEELSPGGVLLVQMLGTDGRIAPPRVSAASLLGLMNKCLMALVADGAIPAEAYATYCFPVVPRTIEEAKAPIKGPLADRLELLHCKLDAVPSPYEQVLAETGDVKSFAASYTAFTRAFSETSLSGALFRSAPDPKALADRFYAMLQQNLAENPNAYPFGDLTLSLIVRRRG